MSTDGIGHRLDPRRRQIRLLVHIVWIQRAGWVVWIQRMRGIQGIGWVHRVRWIVHEAVTAPRWDVYLPMLMCSITTVNSAAKDQGTQ
jgi:hypothetical protein